MVDYRMAGMGRDGLSRGSDHTILSRGKSATWVVKPRFGKTISNRWKIVTV